MRDAARSLNIDLEILEAKDRYGVLDKAEMVLARQEKPEYLMYVYQACVSALILEKAETAGVKSIIVNTDVMPEERASVGKPCGRFTNWVLHVYPDDEGGGRMLAESLVERASSLGLVDIDRTCQINGLGGARDTTASSYRRQGMEKYLVSLSKVVLERFVHTGWAREVGLEKTRLLLRLYPGTRIYWAASDTLALGAAEAVRDASLVPGKDIVIGGIDWSVEGVEAIRRGELTASSGGHFMGGAWALVLLYDIEHGKGPSCQNRTFLSRMRLIDKSSIDKYQPVLNPANWKKIDFKRFTRTANPQFKQYDFSPDAVVKALRRLH